jgi:hypothetical protein
MARMSAHKKESERLRKIAMKKIEERSRKKKGGKVLNMKVSDNLKVFNMLNCYRKMLNEYYHKPIKFQIQLGKINKKHRGYNHYLKAVKLAEARKLDYETYLKGQFYWFDLWFNRAPKTFEIGGGSGTFPAALRIERYLDLLKDGKDLVIKSVAIPVDNMKPAEIDKINKKQLEILQRNWEMDERDIYLHFAVGIESAFNFEWLKTRPVYLDLIKEGLV